MASSTFSRSLFAVLLPLCADKMYVNLGVAWATSLLGFVSLIVACLPFLFIRYGEVICDNSRVYQELLKNEGSREAIMEERQ